MRSKVLAALVALVLATAALAGCIGGDDVDEGASTEQLDPAATNETEENVTDEPEDEGPTLATTWHNGTLEGGNLPTGGWYCTPTSACENGLEFDVPSGTETILVEAAWEEDANAWFNVSGPECESGFVIFEFCSPAEATDGGSPLSIRIDDGRTNATGAWMADIWVDESTPTQIEVTIVATIVEDGELPQGYSALEATSSSS